MHIRKRSAYALLPPGVLFHAAAATISGIVVCFFVAISCVCDICDIKIVDIILEICVKVQNTVKHEVLRHKKY